MTTETIVKDLLNTDPSTDPEEEFSRHLLLVNDELWAWGGNAGTIMIGEQKVRYWDDDDEVTALAVSDNRTVVAVGFETGSTSIYKYSEEELAQAGDKHPFGSSTPLPKHLMESPFLEAGVRDMQFYPGSSNILAVAYEGGLFVLDLSQDDFSKEDNRLLEKEATEQHKGGGVRCIVFSKDKQVMASLGQDGRICLWNVSDRSPSNWKCVIREKEKCVLKEDAGFGHGDAFDHSCRPFFHKGSSILALPGASYLQLRKIEGFKVTEYDQLDKEHIDTMVAFASKGSHLVSTGRDKRVVLWTLKKEKDGALKAKFVRQLAEVESAPTHIVWDDDRLLIICAKGQLVTLTGSIVPDSAAAKPKQATPSKASPRNLAPSPRAFVAAEKPQHATSSTGSSPMVADSPKVSSEAENPKQTTPDSKSSKTSSGETDLNTDPPNEKENNGRLSPDVEASATKPAESSKPSSVTKKSPVKEFNDFDDSDDDDFGDSSPAMSQPAVKRSRFVDDQAADANADDDDGSVLAKAPEDNSPPAKTGTSTASPTQHDDDDDDDDDDIDMPMGTGYDGNHSYYQQPAVDLPEPQPAFAPSSTPLDLTRRFMCWNHIGSITLRRDELVGRNSVDVNFTDKAVRRSITFTDNLGFILGSLGEDGGIFATDIADDDDDDDGDDLDDVVPGLSDKTKQAVKRSQRGKNPNKATGSSLYFHRYESIGNVRGSDWYLTLPNGERALGCATGEGWVAVITSRRFLRLFSSGGNQGHVFWLDGAPITMTGRSRFLAVFYHKGDPLRDGSQKIGYELIDAFTNRAISKGFTSCISSGATLSWVGFDNDGSLLAMDSVGMVSMLVCTDTSGSWEWVPVLDTLGLRKSSDDSFWPVTVYDGKLVCVPLKGGTKHPDATRRPVTSTLNFRLPLARGTLVKSNALEELSIRASIALGQKKVIQELSNDGEEDEEFDQQYTALSAQVDKVTLKMFAAVVEAGKLDRALDLVDRLHNEKSYDLAMAIADSHRKLVDMIEDRKYAKFGGQSDEEEDDDFEDAPDFTEQTGGRRRISPDSTMARMGKRPLDDSGETRYVRQKQTFGH